MIADGSVVEIEYTLHLGDGEVIDRSPEGEPLSYVHGVGEIVPGLERALAGMEPGQSKAVVLPPEEAYGAYDPSAVRELARDTFAADVRLEPGRQFVARGPNDEEQPFSIKEVGEETVLADFNHPLASRTLHFDVTVRSVREATPQELEEVGLSLAPTAPPVDPLARCRGRGNG